MTEQNKKTEYILKAEDLVYEYGIGTPFRKLAVDHVSLGVKSSRITGIIGHTGSGKSTLVQLLNGLLEPQSGKVYFHGADIHADKKKLHELRYRIGLVFQYPEYQLFEDTVGKDIAYGPRNMGMDEESIKLCVEEACDFVGLDRSLLEKSPFDLSGGQKRRVAIAGVIAMHPEVLILDEPASGLDPIGRKSIFDGLLRYRDNTGAAVVIVSHSMEDLAKYAEDIVVLAEDKLVLSGTRDEVFSHADLLIEHSLDIPDIARLAVKLRERGLPLVQNLYTVEDTKEAILALLKGGNKSC
ncbi:MAG: energy-coupling factor transporter ATPase [Clostridia bacterium]|nr:energy-coupling factor transporter ATPase [Clostridia bacterium]